MDYAAIWLTIQLAALTTILLVILATPIAWWLATSRNRFKPGVEALVALPLILPPTVLGFYLLILLGPAGTFGKWWLTVTGTTVTFNFSGLVIASVIYSLPFAVQPLTQGFNALSKSMLEEAATLGASPSDRFLTLAIPASKNAYLTAAVLSFAHTVGEFGVVLMVGGNIPGKTRTISIAIFENVETLNYTAAHKMSALLIAFSFAVLLSVFLLRQKQAKPEGRK